MKTFVLEGAQELDRMLAELPIKVQNRIQRFGLKKAAAPIKRATVEVCPKDTGETARSIAVFAAKQQRRRGRYRKVIAVHIGFKGGPDDSHLVVYSKDGTRHYLPAILEYLHTPFLRWGMVNGRVEALRILMAEVKAAVLRYTKRQQGKANVA